MPWILKDDEEKVITFWKSTRTGEWDAVSIRGGYGVGISMDEEGIMCVTADSTFKPLRLVEV